MEKLIYALVILLIVAVASYWLWKLNRKIKNALINFSYELRASTNLDVFCKEIKNIPAGHLKDLSDEEKEEIINYLRYMVRGHLHLGHLLACINYYEIGGKQKRFITDYLFQAIGVQGSAFMLADIAYSEALGAGGSEKEKKFLLNRCGKFLEFQEIVIKRLKEYQNSPITKGYEALAIGRKIEKLQKEFDNLKV